MANPDPTLLVAALDAAIRAAGVATLVSVRVGDVADRATWKAQLASGAAPADQAAADSVIATFDVSTLGTTSAQMQADAYASQKAIATMVAYIWRVTHAGVNPTALQLQGELATWKLIYKALP